MRRRQFFDKNSKEEFFGGIEFIGEKELSLNDGLDFVTFSEQFQLLKSSKNVSINKNELIVTKCKPNQVVNLKWEIITISKEKISLAFRILKNKEIINSTRVNGFANIEEVQNFGNTLVEINSKDRFIIQIKNTDFERPTEKIIIKTARMILES